MTVIRRIAWLAVGLMAGLLPAVVAAQGGTSRVLSPPDDVWKAIIGAALGVAVVLSLATLGRLYQSERGLHWPFQDPDPDPDEQHEH